jgi:hypothetical protein
LDRAAELLFDGKARHLPQDAGIQCWMQASLSGCRSGICMQMLSARSRASTIGCWCVDNPTRQAKGSYALVAQVPDSALWIPCATGLLHSLAEDDVSEGDAQGDDLVRGQARPWRFPVAFGNQELHRLEPLLPLRIVTIAHADEAVTVLRQKLLRPLLARLEMQPYP